MLQFAKRLHALRKEQQLTQAHIAQYVGVSKAAVSKWETGLSYPDIVLLPKLATFLHVTIDELLGYEPQMSTAQIRDTYTQLAHDFSKLPYDDVYAQVEALIAEYYTCFPLLNQLVILLVNYLHIAPQPDAVMTRVHTLCAHIQKHCDDFSLIEQTRAIKGMLYVQQQQPENVLELFGDDLMMRFGNEGLISMAYVQLGKLARAEQVLQVALYQQLAEMLSCFTQLLTLQIHDDERFHETVRRATTMIETFKSIHLNAHHPLSFHLIAAQCYMQRGEPDHAIAQLQRYVTLCQQLTFPLQLKGDAYFHYVEEWMNSNNMLRGGDAPRDERSIKDELYAQVANNPAFTALQPTLAFRQLLHQLQQYVQ